MAKAVLVMDMPENCDDCKIPLPECYSHVFNKDIPDFKAGGGKPDWCPLIELPDGINSEKLIKLFYKLYDEVVEDGNYDKSKQATLKLIADGIELLNILGMEEE